MSLLIRKAYFGLAYFKPFVWQQEENHLIFVNRARIVAELYNGVVSNNGTVLWLLYVLPLFATQKLINFEAARLEEASFYNGSLTRRYCTCVPSINCFACKLDNCTTQGCAQVMKSGGYISVLNSKTCYL